ncbi:MAG: hypothetical protein EA379_05560 [Phycisphaerales bacterium]|nr:MAG: hypothetical protein EA379_05560 [Phycisphaerales bacterium]
MPQRNDELLTRLIDAGVDFVIVVGAAAFAYGATYPTVDLDAAFRFTRENAERLLRAFDGVPIRHAITPGKRPVTEDASALASLRNLYLESDLGRLDLLGELPPVGGYEDALRRSHSVTLHGREVRLIDIDALIECKEALGRPKDVLVAQQLRAIRERTSHPGVPPRGV